jgi:hypothetical protein
MRLTPAAVLILLPLAAQAGELRITVDGIRSASWTSMRTNAMLPISLHGAGVAA